MLIPREWLNKEIGCCKRFDIAAVKNGHLVCLKYAHEHRCRWGCYVTAWASRNGYLACLKYAHEQGCAWDGQITAYGAENTHLACLKYDHEQGCEWEWRTTVWEWRTTARALRYGQWECYTREHGCKWWVNENCNLKPQSSQSV